MRKRVFVVLAGLSAVLIGCSTPETTPPAGDSGTLLGTVVVVGNTRYDLNADRNTPDVPAAAAVFVRQAGTGSAPTDVFANLRGKCFDTSAAAGLLAALKLPLASGTPAEAGASIGLQAGAAPYGSLARTAAGQYAPAEALPAVVPSTLEAKVPGAAGGFPASSGSLTALSLLQAAGLPLKAAGFSMGMPVIGSQDDLGSDRTLNWTPVPALPAGASSVIILEFYGVQQRGDHVTCLADDTGQFTFRASDPAYVMLQARNTGLRYEAAARATARVKQVNAGAALTTILVDRTVAPAPAP